MRVLFLLILSFYCGIIWAQNIQEYRVDHESIGFGCQARFVKSCENSENCGVVSQLQFNGNIASAIDSSHSSLDVLKKCIHKITSKINSNALVSKDVLIGKKNSNQSCPQGYVLAGNFCYLRNQQRKGEIIFYGHKTRYSYSSTSADDEFYFYK